MQCTAFYLKPKGNFKTELHSDTLWGQLCWGIATLYGQQAIDDLVRSYSEITPENIPEDCFFISSLFTYAISDQDEKVHFLPKPLLPKNFSVEKEMSFSEARTKLREKKKKDKENIWSKAHWEFRCAGVRENVEGLEGPKEKRIAVTHTAINRVIGSALIFRQKQGASATSESIVNVPNDGYEYDELGQLYHTNEYALVHNDKGREVGFYFLARGANKSMKKIEAALRFLSHFGVGGDRTTGKGRFDYLGREPFDLAEPNDANAMATLSLYHPTDPELDFFQKSEERALNYKIKVRKGKGSLWDNNPQKKSLLLFEEGSIFPLLDHKKTIGKNEIVGKHGAGFNIHQYGHAFMVKVKIL